MFEKKQIFKLHILKKLLNDEKNCVSLVPSTRLLALPPFFLNDMKSGILYLLNCMLKKYDRSLGGIVIGYQNIKVLMDENTGIIPIGTPETEVNISVEFYIFQPKIGSLLEGVINKKSNNHIGCLVHRYFNATILKPEDVDFDEWICKGFNVGEKITFKVKDLDFTSLLPYIEGVVDDENLLNKVSVKSDGNSNGSDDVNKSINAVSLSNELLSRININEHSDEIDLKNVKEKKRNKKDLKISNAILDSTPKNTGALLGTKKEKKKKEERSSVCVETEIKKQEESSNKEMTSDCSDVKLKGEESFSEKRKKKKKKKGDPEESSAVGKEGKETELRFEKQGTLLEKYVQLENENSNDFLIPVKSSKEKKKKKKDNDSSSRNFECLSPKEAMFYSTQLEANSESRMSISFCSPIPRGVPLEGREDGSSEVSMTEDGQTSMEREKGKKKKQKKRKREEDNELESDSKKFKSSSDSLPNKDFKPEKSESEKLLEELYKKEVSRVMGDLDFWDEQSSKETKIKKAKMVKEKREETQNELAVSKGRGALGSVIVDEKTFEERDFQDGIYQQRVVDRKSSNSLDREVHTNGNKDARNKTSAKKNIAQRNDLVSDDKKTEKQSKQNELQKTENRMEEEWSDKVTLKGGKKPKTAEQKREFLREGSSDSLYEKLLREARSALDLGNDKTAKCREQEQTPNKKDSELSDFSTTSSKKRNSGKKSKHKEKTKDVQETLARYKNGSMYDVSYSPLKFDPDKSLFTDSEQSQTSPNKKRKKVNGAETVAESKIEVQNRVNEFLKGEMTNLKSKSDREDSTDSVKQKSKRKSRNPKKQKEFLYEKLLKQAKKLIDFKGESTSGNNEKSCSDS